MSFPAQRRKPRDSGKAPRLDTPGRGPGRRAQPGRPSVKPTPLTPGSDDNRRRRLQRPGKPGVSFGNKARAPSVGPKLGRFFDPFKVKIPMLPSVYDLPGFWQAVRNPRHPGVPILPTPARWRFVNGLNRPEIWYSPSYWDDRNRGYFASTQAYRGAGVGEGTGTIAGQAITPNIGAFPGNMKFTGPDVGWWIKNETLNRYAQFGNFRKYAVDQFPDYRQQLVSAYGAPVIWIPPIEFPPLPNIEEGGEPSSPPPFDVGVGGVADGSTAPFVAPALEIAPGVTNTVDRPHIRRPPGKGTKERKGVLGGSLDSLRRVLGGWSEFNDVVSALHDALPDQYKAKSFFRGKQIEPSWKKQWNAVYQHFDKIDLNKALANLAKDHLQDEVIGRLSKFKTPFKSGSQPPIGRTNFASLTRG